VGAIAVVFDRGAASAAEIAAAIPPIAPLVSVLGPGIHAELARPLLVGHGAVVSSADGFAHTLAELRRLGVAGITTFSESMLKLTCDLAAALSLPFHGEETTRLLTDKSAQRRMLNMVGVSPIRTAEVRTAAGAADALDKVGLPAIVKPTTGDGSRNTYFLDERVASRQLISDLVSAAAGQVTMQPWSSRRISRDGTSGRSATMSRSNVPSRTATYFPSRHEPLRRSRLPSGQRRRPGWDPRMPHFEDLAHRSDHRGASQDHWTRRVPGQREPLAAPQSSTARLSAGQAPAGLPDLGMCARIAADECVFERSGY
jgi:hypothetical protein